MGTSTLKTSVVTTLALTLLACGTAQGLDEAAPTTRAQPTIEAPKASFDSWLADMQVRDEGVDGLYYAYRDVDGKAGKSFISTMVSAEVLRYKLRLGKIDEAIHIGDALLSWQHDGSGEAGAILKGAFPAEIGHTAGGYAANYLYDSSENLLIIAALVELYDATKLDGFLEAARHAGVWIRDVMAHGERYGMWVEAHGAPMKAATDFGAFDNRIAVGRTLFWIVGLDMLSARTGDSSFAAVAKTSREFLLQGQRADGAIMDHYDPGYPAQPFSIDNFKGFVGNEAVVADESIRAAIALTAAGYRSAGEAFMKWLKHDNGRVAGYVDLKSGEGYAPGANIRYYDVVSTSLLQALATRLGEPALGQDFVAQAQANDGGWYWGWDRDKDIALEGQSTLTSLWALEDLTVVDAASAL